MRAEIKRLHKRMEATSIYVTHDQVEAMTLADRIVIMSNGHIEQVGSPMEVFLEPANTFVASFIGSPPMNLIDATVASVGGALHGVIATESGKPAQSLPLPAAFLTNAHEGQAVKLGIRPEAMVLHSADGPAIDCAIDLVEPLGAEALLHGRVNGQAFIAKAETPLDLSELWSVERFGIDTARMHVFDAETGKTLKAWG